MISVSAIVAPAWGQCGSTVLWNRIRLARADGAHGFEKVSAKTDAETAMLCAETLRASW